MRENTQTVDETRNTATHKFIQHSTKDEGESKSVEQVQFDGVLQTEQFPNSSTTKIDPTSVQESFNRKYQLVEVLNRDGEWVRGYWVHKYIVVANLEAIERKWALYDEPGSVYVFWREIRLPRVG